MYNLYRSSVNGKVGAFIDFSDCENYIRRGLNESHDATYAVYVDNSNLCHKAYCYDNGNVIEMPAIFFDRIDGI